jgi:hypothetical protein
MNDEAARPGGSDHTTFAAPTVATDGRLDALAGDVGRLRRSLDPESYGGFLIARIAGHIETLDAILQPTAGELYREADVPLTRALATVDERSRTLRRLLGEKRL